MTPQQNAFESGTQKVIPAVLLYAFYQDSLLMIHRKDGKWNGLGGKLELGETAAQAAAREFFEESHCKVPEKQWRWLGQLYFPNFKPKKSEDWWVNVFTTQLTDEQAKSIPPNTDEGSLHFVAKNKILDLNLWDGDRYFFPLVLKHQSFNGTFFYEDGKCKSHELEVLR